MQSVAVLASGRGSNLQALLDAGVPVACVLSDRADAGALDRARSAGIPAAFIDPGSYAHRAAFDDALEAELRSHRVELVILAGFMRILGSGFVQRWQGRMLNIHPSLLPKYRGLHTHRRALEAGDKEHGASVHFVTEELDGGPVILQAIVPVNTGDDERTLTARVQDQEHRVYPWVVNMIISGRITLAGDAVVLDGVPLDSPLKVLPETDLSCVAA